MYHSLLPLLTLATVITHHVGCFFLAEKGEPKGPIVQLFEWRFDDIAEECEQFLGPNGYSGVQVSPVTESVSLDGDPWYERYQPISYKIGSRSGNHDEFRRMIKRCTRAQVKVYVEVVINHMTKKYESKVYGTSDSLAYPMTYSYPEVPYIQGDFRPPCEITDYNNATQVRNCALDGLLELDQSKHGVRCKISQFLNELIELGVAGFSFSHAKYMWPEDLRAIIDRLDYLSAFQGFGYFQNPFVYQEFVEGGAVKPNEYYNIGLVTDFKYSFELTQAFSGKKDLKVLKNLASSERALVFVDNHLTQRGQGFENSKSLTYREARRYTLANLFMLAWPHGQPRIMSGYEFENVEQGPPKGRFGKIARVQPQKNGACANGWTCEHRWLLINQMLKFRKYIKDFPVENWWDNGKNQIAFSRGDRGFVVFNLDSTDMRDVSIKTGLPGGSYCDIFSGFRTTGGQCTGKRINVAVDGIVNITLKASDEYGVIAIFQQDWLPYLPPLLAEQYDQVPESVSNAATSSSVTQGIQNEKSADTEKKEISSNNKQAGTFTEEQDGNKNAKTEDETNEKVKSNQEISKPENQDGTSTGSQNTADNDKTKVPSAGKEDVKDEKQESQKIENEQKSTGKRSLLYVQDTSFVRRGAPTTSGEKDEKDKTKKEIQNVEKPKQDVKENKHQKTEHEGSKDITGTQIQDKTNNDKQDIKSGNMQTVSSTEKQTDSITEKQIVSTTDKQSVSIPEKQTVSPDTQTDSSPEKQTISTMDEQTDSSPGKQTVSTTDKQIASIPEKQTVSPVTQTDSSPEKQTISTMDEQTDSSPGKQTVSTTDKQIASIPEKQTVSPDTQTDSSPEKQTISTMDEQTDSSPGKQTTLTTDKQTDSSRDKQTVSTTDKQTVSSQDKQTASTTDKQTTSSPEKQTVSPDKQTDSSPEKQTISTTDKQTDSTPDKQSVSTTDKQTDSSQDKQTVSTTDKQIASSQDKQTISPDKQTASSPDKLKITNIDKEDRNTESPSHTTTSQDVSSTDTQQNPNTGTKKPPSSDNQKSSKTDSQQVPDTERTQSSPKSDNQPANANQGTANVGEHRISAPESRDLPILGHPWIPRIGMFDFPDPDSDEEQVFGDRSWKQYYRTINNRKYIKYARVANLMDNSQKKIIHSFQRRGFILINRGRDDDMVDVPLLTELPTGLYCDVITGTPAPIVNCTGKQVLIDPQSVGRFTLEKKSPDDIVILRPENTKKYRLKDAFHRQDPPEKWNEVYKTVKFSVHDQTDRFYTDIPVDQYALRKGKKGFMLFKTYDNEMVNVPLLTGLPSGLYCDMVSGNLTAEGDCTGRKITVEPYGVANFTLKSDDHLIVIHEGSMIEKVLQ